MKKLLSILFLLALVQQLLAIDVSLSYASFKSPQSTYIEIYLYVLGKSVTFKEITPGSSEKQAAVEMNIIFKKDDQIFLVERVLIKDRKSVV